jgi:hypothetical protein
MRTTRLRTLHLYSFAKEIDPSSVSQKHSKNVERIQLI